MRESHKQNHLRWNKVQQRILNECSLVMTNYTSHNYTASHMLFIPREYLQSIMSNECEEENKTEKKCETEVKKSFLI